VVVFIVLLAKNDFRSRTASAAPEASKVNICRYFYKIIGQDASRASFNACFEHHFGLS